MPKTSWTFTKSRERCLCSCSLPRACKSLWHATTSSSIGIVIMHSLSPPALLRVTAARLGSTPSCCKTLEVGSLSRPFCYKASEDWHWVLPCLCGHKCTPHGHVHTFLTCTTCLIKVTNVSRPKEVHLSLPQSGIGEKNCLSIHSQSWRAAKSS